MQKDKLSENSLKINIIMSFIFLHLNLEMV